MEKKIQNVKRQANKIRRLIIEMIGKAGSGHPGGSLSSADIVACLFFEVMRHTSSAPKDPGRDRFHLSKGHCCPAVYAALALCGYFPEQELSSLRKAGALLQGHPDKRTPGIEAASGSLGQGLSIALGMALAGRLDGNPYRVYCLLGDGELQEGGVWEAAMACSHYKADTLCAIVDYNHCQIDGRCEDVMGLEPLAHKWEAFGWHVIQCDGHNISDLLTAFNQARTITGKPTVIIAQTVKGKGVSFMEHVVDFHGRAPNTKECAIALQELAAIEQAEHGLGQ